MNIVITGAGKGIGFETTKTFAREPGNRIVAISRNKHLLENLLMECTSLKAKSEILTIPCDLTSATLVKELPGKISRFISSVDILINNAGLLINKPFENLTEKDFDEIFSTNVKSVFILIQVLLPYLITGSHIVNISSMGGFQGSLKFSGLSIYSASKGALAVLSECLAEEFKEKGINVNCLAIGSVQTEMFDLAFPGYKAQLSTGQMAEFIKDFASNGHHFMNGKIIPVSLKSP